MTKPLQRRVTGFLASLWLCGNLGWAVEEPSAMRLAPGYRELPYALPQAGSYRLSDLGPAGDGRVLDSTGRAHRLHDLFGGHLILLSFVYSTCDDVNGCPLATAVLHKVAKQAQRDPLLAGRLHLITLSFNPAHDTPEVMAAYGAAFRIPGVSWSFLTGNSAAELAAILKSYGQDVEPERDAQGKLTGTLSHTLRVFLIDGQRRIRNIYTPSYLHADLLMADLKTLLAEDTANNRATRSSTPAVDLVELAKHPGLGLPSLPVPADNRLTSARISLGRKLFFDRRLSLNNTISCAMCHVPEQGFGSREQATAVGIEGRTVRRNAPTLWNVGYQKLLFHDGREDSLERQIWGPLLAGNEMGNPSIGQVIGKLKGLRDYRGRFEAAYGRGPSMETVGMALASYQRALVSGNSPFDRWYFGNQPQALDAAAQRGFALFVGKGNCASCHAIGTRTALFTDHALHNTGVGYQRSMGSATGPSTVEVAPGLTVQMRAEDLRSLSEPAPPDLGRYEITQRPEDRWKYRTPTLRNIALTSPYMHDGSLPDLRSVVDFYNRGGVPNEGLDPLLQPLHLSDSDITDLVRFLESLTGDHIDAVLRDAAAAPIGDPR